jgi:hypothetical protein
VANVTRDLLPKADAILCRDCLVHLPVKDVLAAVELFKQSGSTYLIATTFPKKKENVEPGIAGWWPLNMTLEPYKFPPPIRYLAERDPDPNDTMNDKSLGVWRLADL